MTNIDTIYDRRFYAENLANKWAYDALAEAIHCVIPRGRVLDVGCGCGLVLNRLHELDYPVFGLEGSAAGIASAPDVVRPTIRQVDLTGPWPDIVAQTSICIEVAEHLPHTAANPLVQQLTERSEQCIIWSAAPPGQGGTDHVNEQPPDYWLSKFAAVRWRQEEIKTSGLRTLMRASLAQHHGYANNFYVLKRGV
jgi:hypothetical protein